MSRQRTRYDRIKSALLALTAIFATGCFNLDGCGDIDLSRSQRAPSETHYAGSYTGTCAIEDGPSFEFDFVVARELDDQGIGEALDVAVAQDGEEIEAPTGEVLVELDDSGARVILTAADDDELVIYLTSAPEDGHEVIGCSVNYDFGHPGEGEVEYTAP